ncbi:tRNA N(3)-methylcytidine methyltransferase METTL6 [Linum perenne]
MKVEIIGRPCCSSAWRCKPILEIHNIRSRTFRFACHRWLRPNPKPLSAAAAAAPAFSNFTSQRRMKAAPAMASNSPDTTEQQKPSPKLQIYPTSATGVTPFWREKYERNAMKYWDVFYKRHEDRFFKDRHYLEKEWDDHISGPGRKVILEVIHTVFHLLGYCCFNYLQLTHPDMQIGCGAGNTIFPLIATYPEVFIHACDFSPRAIDLVKLIAMDRSFLLQAHKDYTETRISAFVCDLTIDDLSKEISPSSVDVVTMIFVLSAVSPEKMPLVLQNIRKVLKPNGRVLLRDYATGDLAQERFSSKNQKISENFYVRGDGTRAYYFSNDFLKSLFEDGGFCVEDLDVYCKQVENRSRELVMNRRWIQAVFQLSDHSKSSIEEVSTNKDCNGLEQNHSPVKESTSNEEVDISEGLAAEMFGMLPSNYNEVIEVKVGGQNLRINLLSKEYQHTCRSTGLMLWDSARLMCSVLAGNPSIVAGKKVLELGSGCAGICSMAAVEAADLVVATDGDTKALDLLTQNVVSNLSAPFVSKLITKRLEWGNREHIEAIKELNAGGFEVIIGTDVTYVSDAILPLFATAKELIATSRDGEPEPALILCHVIRRVDEPSILSAASQFGFTLVDKWRGASPNESQSIVSSWFLKSGCGDHIPSTALNIMYFQAGGGNKQ